MTGKISDLEWWRVIVAAVLALAIAWVTVFIVVTGYAAKLGFELRGAPPQDQISAFADRVAPKLGPVVTVLSTFLLALWAARKAAAGKALNGLAVGILVTVVAIALGRSFSLAALTAWLLTLGAGWLGGAAGSRSGPSSAA